MQWTDEGVVLGTRRLGEGNLVAEVLTREHGRHLGLVRGGAGPRLRPVLQPGNTLQVTWRARLDEHLGAFAVETLRSRAAALLGSGIALHGLALVVGHLRLLPERDAHPGLFAALEVVLDNLDAPALAAPLLVRFELALLEELGFGLDLAACAATGVREELTHVSPRTGRAVSRTAAEPWRDRLFALPAFLRDASGASPSARDVAEGFRLTGHFLERDVWGPRGLTAPPCRGAILEAVARAP